MTRPPFNFLLHPVLDDKERAVLLLHMARVAYEAYSREIGVKPSWDSLPLHGKEAWGVAVREAVRAMANFTDPGRPV